MTNVVLLLLAGAASIYFSMTFEALIAGIMLGAEAGRAALQDTKP